jgi:hypothetical protein
MKKFNTKQRSLYLSNNKKAAEKGPFIAQAINNILGEEAAGCDIDTNNMFKTTIVFSDNSSILLILKTGNLTYCSPFRKDEKSLAERCEWLVEFVCNNLYYIENGLRKQRDIQWFTKDNYELWAEKNRQIIENENKRLQEESKKKQVLRNAMQAVSMEAQKYTEYYNKQMFRHGHDAVWKVKGLAEYIDKRLDDICNEHNLTPKETLTTILNIFSAKANLQTLPRKLQNIGVEVYRIKKHALENNIQI